MVDLQAFNPFPVSFDRFAPTLVAGLIVGRSLRNRGFEGTQATLAGVGLVAGAQLVRNLTAPIFKEGTGFKKQWGTLYTQPNERSPLASRFAHNFARDITLGALALVSVAGVLSYTKDARIIGPAVGSPAAQLFAQFSRATGWTAKLGRAVSIGALVASASWISRQALHIVDKLAASDYSGISLQA